MDDKIIKTKRRNLYKSAFDFFLATINKVYTFHTPRFFALNPLSPFNFSDKYHVGGLQQEQQCTRL